MSPAVPCRTAKPFWALARPFIRKRPRMPMVKTISVAMASIRVAPRRRLQWGCMGLPVKDASGTRGRGDGEHPRIGRLSLLVDGEAQGGAGRSSRRIAGDGLDQTAG